MLKTTAIVLALALGASAFTPAQRPINARVRALRAEEGEETAAAPAPAPAPAAPAKKEESPYASPKGANFDKKTTGFSYGDLQALAAEQNPVVQYFDPLFLGDQDFWGQGNEATIGFLRQAEIKHGRVAMAAFVGFIVHANGITWPFPMRLDGTPWPTADSGPELWDKLPEASKWQIIFFIGALEWFDEWQISAEGSELNPTENKPKHYMRGGMPGKFAPFEGLPLPLNLFDPFQLSKKKTEEQKAKGRIAEVNNGRLAMFGIMGFLAESKVPGSVPFLDQFNLPVYSGDLMAPFSNDFSFF